MRIKPSDASPHIKTGELYLTSTNAGFRDAGKALQHARLACRLTHYGRRDALALLALAYAENRQPNEAADAAQKTLALSVGPKEIRDAEELVARGSRVAAIMDEVTSSQAPETQ